MIDSTSSQSSVTNSLFNSANKSNTSLNQRDISDIAGSINSSDKDIASLISRVFNDTSSSSSANQITLQHSLERRSQLIGMITNILRTLHDSAMSIIHNLRVS